MKRIIIISVIYVVLCALYFTNAHLPSKLTYPVAFLGVMALIDYKHIGIWMACGLVFSALGDWQGTQGYFLGQMCFFGLAHLAYIGYFISRIKRKMGGKNAICFAIPCMIIGVFAIIKVVPMAPPGIIQIGVSIYCLLILTMLWSALQQKDKWFALGAILFVISDFILAWNKFVSAIDYASWFIMVPYYGAQWFFFVRATIVALNVCSCTSQDK